MSRLSKYLALEARGKVESEHELILICKISNLRDLRKASKTLEIEQWEIKTVHHKEGLRGTIRVRRTGRDYTLATKHYNHDTGTQEAEQEIGRGIFEHFKILAPMGSYKVRHIFPIPNSKLKWEIDVYYDNFNTPIPWCKVDLEHDGTLEDMPELPIEMEEVIGEPRTPEQSEFVSRLFSEEFQQFNDENILPVESPEELRR